MSIETIFLEVAAEVIRSTSKHGSQDHLPDGTGPHEAAVLEADAFMQDGPDLPENEHYAEAAKARTKAASQNEGGDGSITWEQILTEEWAEAIAEADPEALRAELVQVMAVAAKWIDAIDKRTEGPTGTGTGATGSPHLFPTPRNHSPRNTPPGRKPT